MKKIFLFIVIFWFNEAYCFPIPKDNKVTFDIIRKNKTIGSVNTEFRIDEDKLVVHTLVDIKVKILLFPAYKFHQETTEVWIDNNLVEIDGYTDFEDEREYFIKGADIEDHFIASGMDGELKLHKEIISLNYWNKEILSENEVFDTQKGIVRKISVKKLEDETIKINNKKIKTEKYTLDASKNPKDKGPFPTYTLWYKGDELMKFEFINWKDKKKITTIRNDLNN